MIERYNGYDFEIHFTGVKDYRSHFYIVIDRRDRKIIYKSSRRYARNEKAREAAIQYIDELQSKENKAWTGRQSSISSMKSS